MTNIVLISNFFNLLYKNSITLSPLLKSSPSHRTHLLGSQSPWCLAFVGAPENISETWLPLLIW